MKKILPAAITSYDLFKMLAVLLMLVDHIGYYFYPDDQWLRVIGRMCVPIWFFLIGFARTRDLDKRFLIGWAILVAGDIVGGHGLLPTNILFTMLIMRLCLDPVTRVLATGGGKAMWPLILLGLGVTIPSMFVFEYGFMGMYLVLMGWMMRQQQDNTLPEALSATNVNHFMIATFVIFVILQQMTFNFSQYQFYALAAGQLVIFGLLMFFRPRTYPGLTEKLGFAASIIRFFGRRTLEIYVGHLILFKILALYLQPDRFVFMNWSWTFPS